MIHINEAKCPLCGNSKIDRLNTQFKKRLFYLCDVCFLIFVDRPSLPTPEDEKLRYEHHQNQIGNTRYVEFLMKAIDPLLQLISKSDVGLDYGCGPNMITEYILRRSGYRCESYDPIFYPDIKEKTFDYIISTEVFEHFHIPELEIDKALKLLRPGGYISIMTELWTQLSEFSSWYYIRDYTHVSFYHTKTLLFIENKYDLSQVYSDQKRVFIFQKNQ